MKKNIQEDKRVDVVGVAEKEIKHAIRGYVAVPYNKIKRLESKCQQHKTRAYNKHSFMGTAKYGFTIDDYKHAINVERFVILLVMEQEALDRQLQALRMRYKLFKEVLPTIDYPTLKTLLKHDILTDYEAMIYQEIQEINYYIEQHKRTLAQQQADNEVASLDLNEDDIKQMLNSDDWDTPKETKISVLSNVEDELMALLA